MIFALLQASLGWALASFAALVLRRRPASARCWAWRLGILKGPLALLFAVPVVVVSRPAPGLAPAVAIPTPSLLQEDRSYRPYKTDTAYQEPLRKSYDPLPLVYGAGVAATLLARLLASRRVNPAMPRVEGVLRPRVVVPDGLPPEAVAMAHAHEAAHVRRRDPQWSLVADLVCAGLWFAPPVWQCARAMRAEAEAACDAAALDATAASRRDYARLLLSFAGPAPANALGGPARRLARRILMLEKGSNPIPRLAAAPLLALGLLALLPWRAVAAQDGPQNGPLHGDAHWHPAARIPLELAAKTMLGEPGVKARVGWTPAQDEAVVAGARRWQAVWNAFAAELYRRKDAMTLRAWNEWDRRERPKALARAEAAAGPYPWTPAQERALKSLALARHGSAVWKDPQVADRLQLTPAQKQAITKENRAIAQAAQAGGAGRLVRPVKPVPPSVRRQVAALSKAYGEASVARRKALYAEIAGLEGPYQPVYRGSSLAERKADEERRLAKAWRMRAEADRRLAATLTAAQRRTLDALKKSPQTWHSSIPTTGGRDVVAIPTTEGSKVVKMPTTGATPDRRRLDYGSEKFSRYVDRLRQSRPADGPSTLNGLDTKAWTIQGKPLEFRPDPDSMDEVATVPGTGNVAQWRIYRRKSQRIVPKPEGEIYTYAVEALYKIRGLDAKP